MIECTCPQCGQHFSLNEDCAGKKANCAHCQHLMDVPGAEAGAAAHPASALSDPAPALAQPVAVGNNTSQFANSPAFTGRMTQALRDTKPWVTFLAIIGFIFSGLMVIGGLVFMVVFSVSHFAGGPGPGFAAVGLIYVALGALYLVPACYLFGYGRAIKQFLSSGQAAAAEIALEKQKSFWKFVGILTAIFICIYVVILLGAAVVALVAGFHH